MIDYFGRKKISDPATIQVERPGTWTNLRGASYMLLDIIWSEDVDSRDVDEPSSYSSPRMTDLKQYITGAGRRRLGLLDF